MFYDQEYGLQHYPNSLRTQINNAEAKKNTEYFSYESSMLNDPTQITEISLGKTYPAQLYPS